MVNASGLTTMIFARLSRAYLHIDCVNFLRSSSSHGPGRYAALSSAGSALQRQTNTEPGAVATGSSNNRLICNGHGPGRYSIYERALPVPYLSTHDAERPATNPVATAPRSVFVDPRYQSSCLHNFVFRRKRAAAPNKYRTRSGSDRVQ
jgi:hypothetical protein